MLQALFLTSEKCGFLPRGQWPVIKCRWVEFSSQAWALNKDPLEKQDSEDWKETSQGAVQWSSSHRCERKSRIHPKDQWSHDRQDILTWGKCEYRVAGVEVGRKKTISLGSRLTNKWNSDQCNT